MAPSKFLPISVTLALLCICSGEFLNQPKEMILYLRNSLHNYLNKKADILFLLDNSLYVSREDFGGEKRFVMNLLHEMAVAFDATRVQVIPYGASASSAIDFISNPARNKNKCLFVERFRQLSYQGGSGALASAFNEAWSVIFGAKSGDKRSPVRVFKTVVLLLSSGRWSGPDPRLRAKQLRDGGVEVLAFGVGSSPNLNNLRTLVGDQVVQLSSFNHFSELATYIRGGEETTLQVT